MEIPTDFNKNCFHMNLITKYIIEKENQKKVIYNNIFKNETNSLNKNNFNP